MPDALGVCASLSVAGPARGVGGIALLPRMGGGFGDGIGTNEKEGMEGVMGGKPCGVIEYALEPA